MTDFIAKLNYLRIEDGGRRSPAFSGYRPHIKFPFSESMTSGQQIFLDKERVYPGDEVTAEIIILDHITTTNRLSKGLTFTFQEGHKIIGTGEILEVINKKLEKK